MHDAVQLGAIHADIKAGKRSIFVSADRRLRDNLSNKQISFLANAIVSHVGLTQLVDLLVGNPAEPRGVSDLLWSTQISSSTEQIRDYFIDLALSKYHEGLIMEMPHLVDSIAEDAAAELDKQKLDLYAGGAEDRHRVREVLEGFEELYFQRMREVIENERKH